MITLKLIGNELIKLMNRRKTLVITLLFALLIAFVGFATYKNAENMKEWNNPERRIQMEKENIVQYERMRKDSTIPDSDKVHFDEEIKIANERIDSIKKEQKGEKLDWKVTLSKEIKGMEEQLKSAEMPSEEKERVKINLNTRKYLLSNNIQPEENSYKPTASVFIRDLFGMLGMIFLAVGVIIFSADMVSGEYTPPTMKFLLTQPVSRGKVLFSKFIALILSSTIIIVLVEFIAFIIMGLLFGFGSMDYPVSVGTQYIYDSITRGDVGEKAIKIIEGSTYMIPMWKYILQMFLMQVLFIISSASFAFLLSTVVKSSMVSMAVSTVSVVAFTIFQAMPYTRKYVQYLFTTYGDVGKIVTGNIAQIVNNPNVTTMYAIALLLIWSAASYIISHIVFVRKDILI